MSIPPASTKSGIPSLSESKSKELGIPSPSVSAQLFAKTLTKSSAAPIPIEPGTGGDA